MLSRRLYGRRDPEPEPAREFSNLQLQITGKPAQAMKKMAAAIPDADLATAGREDEPHSTARWGLHFMTPSARLRAALAAFGPVNVKFGKTSLFQNPEFDVLKIDIDSPDLHRLYKLIGRVVPVHTTHPVYKPHATIAYLKPGKGSKYAGDKALDGTTMAFSSVLFSGKHGHREVLPLTGGTPLYKVR